MHHPNQAHVFGRLLRFLTGTALTIEAGRHMAAGPMARSMAVVVILVGFVAFYSLVHWAIVRYGRGINRWAGAMLAISPLIVVFAVGGATGRLGSLLFVGISLVVAGARGDAGCEVLALPAIFARERTHLMCMVFSPLDWLEEKGFGHNNSGPRT